MNLSSPKGSQPTGQVSYSPPKEAQYIPTKKTVHVDKIVGSMVHAEEFIFWHPRSAFIFKDS
jgi:hypothetical protein